MTICPFHLPELASAKCKPACRNRELPWANLLKSPASPKMPPSVISVIPLIPSILLAKVTFSSALVASFSTFQVGLWRDQILQVIVLGVVYKHQELESTNRTFS